MSGADLDALGKTLARQFRTQTRSVELGARTVELLHPASAEELIDERDFARDERLPYWAEIWPSALVLARHVIGLRGAGRTLLELGCGAGLVTTAATLAGFRVAASDYYDDALRFARYNAWRNAQARVSTRNLDWRHLPRDLPRFDVVVASDVLYERPYAALVADAIGRTLAPGGVAYLTDPGRLALDEFLKRLRERGLEPDEPDRIAYADGEIRQTIKRFEIRWADASR